ncbi:MAG: hypothetical protein QM500_19760, partial [Methylococcales bacterium]
MIKHRMIFFASSILFSGSLYSHDTTHIHPLLTSEVAELIKVTDSSNSAYSDIYQDTPDELKNDTLPGSTIQRLYWGTDFDSNTDNPLPQSYLQKDQLLQQKQ